MEAITEAASKSDDGRMVTCTVNAQWKSCRLNVEWDSNGPMVHPGSNAAHYKAPRNQSVHIWSSWCGEHSLPLHISHVLHVLEIRNYSMYLYFVFIDTHASFIDKLNRGRQSDISYVFIAAAGIRDMGTGHFHNDWHPQIPHDSSTDALISDSRSPGSAIEGSKEKNSLPRIRAKPVANDKEIIRGSRLYFPSFSVRRSMLRY